ncbi:MAG: dihydropteridine reductase, partial [Clostridia bacterium]|nr:dihydropteridine reductase [Clostridia bacterium]
MNRNDKSFMVEKIRTKYVEKKDSSLDELRKLDKKVKAPAEVFAYIFGSISALIMGAGMSLVMTDVANMLGLGDMTVPGIAVGVVGMVLAIVNYPIYKGILTSRKKKYADKILALSNKILSEEEKA